MTDNYFRGISGERVLGPGFCTCVHISPKNDLVVTSSSRILLFQNLRTGEIIDRLPIDYCGSFYTEFSDNDKMVVIYSEKDENMHLWDLDSRREIREFRGHEKWINGVRFFNSNKNLISYSWDNTIRLWDIESGKEIRKFAGHEDQVTSIDFIEERNLLVSCSYDKTIRLWDIRSGELLETLEGHEYLITDVSLSPDGNTLVSCSFDHSVRIWDMETGKEKRCLYPNIGNLDYCQFLDNGKIFETHSPYYLVKFWDTVNYEEVRIPGFNSNLVEWIVEDKDGGLLGMLPRNYRVYLSSQKGSFSLNDLINDRQHELELLSRGPERYPQDLHIILDRQYKEYVTIEDPEDSKQFDENKNLVLPDYYPDPRFKGSDICIFNLATGKEVFHTEGYKGLSNSVAFSPDGKFLATGYSDGNLRIRHAATGEIIRVLNGHYDNTYTKVAFSPDSRYIINSTDMENVCMREVSTGEKVREFPIDGDFDLQDDWITGVENETGNVCLWNIFSSHLTTLPPNRPSRKLPKKFTYSGRFSGDFRPYC